MTLESREHTFTQFFEKENDALYRFCYWRVSNKETALELTQETFARLWGEMARGKEIENPRAFIYVVAKRLIIDGYRKHKSVSLEGLSEDDERPFEKEDARALEEMEVSHDAKRVLSLIDQLDPKQREAIYLRFVEDLAPREIAEILKTTPNAISIRLSRGLEELRRISGIEIDEK